jgi:hypothetical protein
VEVGEKNCESWFTINRGEKFTDFAMLIIYIFSDFAMLLILITTFNLFFAPLNASLLPFLSRIKFLSF